MMFNIRKRAQQGMMLLEILVALGILSTLYVGVSQTLDVYNERTRYSGVSQHGITFRDAAEKYIADNYSAVSAIATATNPALIRVSTLSGAGYLSAGYSAANPVGQVICALVLQPTAGNLQAMVVTEGGTAINDMDLGMVAAQIPQGGGIYTNAPATLRGAMGTYSLAVGNFANANNAGVHCDGTSGAVSFAPGHLIAALWMANGDKTAGLLYRNTVAGQPQLNQMNTPLVMASVQTINSACTTTGAIARETSGSVISCQGGQWKAASGAAYWKDPVANFSSLPGSGNSVGDVRATVDTGRAFMWTGGGWAPLAVDQLGNLTVPGTLTAAGGKVIAWNQVAEGGVLQMQGANGMNVFLENTNGVFRLINHPWNMQLFSVDQSGNLGAAGRISGVVLNPDLIVTEGASCSGYNGGDIAKDFWGMSLSCQSGSWRRTPAQLWGTEPGTSCDTGNSRGLLLGEWYGKLMKCVYGTWVEVKEGGGTLVGYGHSEGTDEIYIYPPAGSSISTHKIVVFGSEFNQCNHEAQHASNWAFELTSDAPLYASGSRYCPGWSSISYIAIATPR